MNGRKVFDILQKDGFDAGVFFDERNSLYLSDFYTTDGAVIVAKNETLLLTDSRYIEAAETEMRAGRLSEDVSVRLHSGIYAALAEYFTACGIKKIAFDPQTLTVAELERLKKSSPECEFLPAEGVCAGVRMIKTAAEVKKIKAAQAITDLTFTHMLSFIRKGLTERECAAEMEYFMRSHGADGIAFDTIAVSGKKSSLPHGVPGNEVLTENSFFTMDFGAKYLGYCSDMTRTVVLGKADDEMKRVYSTVQKAQAAGIAAAKAGVVCSEVDRVARDIIYSAGYEGCFGHGLGHSLGLDIHESPRFSPKCQSIAEVGEIMTVEPGVYLPGKYGVRIEDMVLITENGCENLTNSPKELIEL